MAVHIGTVKSANSFLIIQREAITHTGSTVNLHGLNASLYLVLVAVSPLIGDKGRVLLQPLLNWLVTAAFLRLAYGLLVLHVCW